MVCALDPIYILGPSMCLRSDLKAAQSNQSPVANLMTKNHSKDWSEWMTVQASLSSLDAYA